MIFYYFRNFALLLVTTLIGVLPVRSTQAEGPPPVDLALVLAIDVSSSVNWTEFGLQMRGFSSALRHADVWQAARSGAHQKIAIALLQWAGEHEQRLSINWTIIASRRDLRDLADRIDKLGRAFPYGGTGLAGALAASAALFETLPVTPMRKVIDISGDGRATVGIWPEAVRDPVLARGITINGLPILNEEPDLEAYYQTSVIGGAGAFTEVAKDYDDFAHALLRKLKREIKGQWLGASVDKPRGADFTPSANS